MTEINNSQEELERFLRDISLVEYAALQGYEIDSKKHHAPAYLCEDKAIKLSLVANRTVCGSIGM